MIKYPDDFERIWKGCDQPRQSSRKEMGYKVYYKSKEELDALTKELKEKDHTIKLAKQIADEHEDCAWCQLAFSHLVRKYKDK